MTMQEFFSARELGEIAAQRGLKNFPRTERGTQILAERKGWNGLPDNLCRKRDGQKGGGGLEYHYSILPDLMQAVIRGRETRSEMLVARREREERDERVKGGLSAMALRARQRTVMEKRAETLVAIERYGIVNGALRSTAIKAFLRAQDEYAAWTAADAKRRRDAALSAGELALLAREPLLTSPDGFDLTIAALEVANDRKRGDCRVSRSAVYAWFQAYDTGGVAALAPAITREVEPPPPGFAAFLPFYANPGKPTVTEALQDYMATVTDPALALTERQVRYTLKNKLNDIERNVGREGLLTLRSRMAYIQRTTDDLWPTTIYTADGKTFDAQVADWKTGKPVKPEITSILDVATRKCVGFALSRKENVISVTEALRKACVSHGIPAIFYTDRGAGYKNKTFDADANGLMGRLAITKMHALPYNSQAKGIIERFNGSVWNPLARKLPTYLGRQMDKEASAKVHKQVKSDIAQYGASRLLVSWEDFHGMCAGAIAEYNARPHDGLPEIVDPATGRRRHMSPDEAWAAHVANGFEPVPVDDDIRDDLFRPYEIRTARRALVEWNRNMYFHPALEAYHGERVMVGYDFDQARYVWVREIDRHEGQPGRLICVADYTGGKESYVPRSYRDAAEEARVKGRLKRLDAKRLDAEAERIAPMLIDHQPQEPMITIIPPVREVVPSKPMSLANDNTDVPHEAPQEILPPAPVKRGFATDVELAHWAITHPGELTANQLRVLRGCLQKPAATRLFEMSGIDVIALRSLVLAAA